MEHTSKVNARNAFLGSQPLGAVTPPVAPAPAVPTPVAQSQDRSPVSARRPLERMLEPGTARLRQTAATQTPSLNDAASNNDWLEWATTFG